MFAKNLFMTSAIYCIVNLGNSGNVDDMASQFTDNGEASSNDGFSQTNYRPGVKITLQNHKNGYFFGEIILGTPAPGQENQQFSVIFDTGSIDLWVPSRQACLSGAVTCDTQAFHSGFDASQSSTFQDLNNPYVALYGDGSEAHGRVVCDVLQVGSGESTIFVPQLTFGLVDSFRADSDKADGIFGLGFGIKSAFKGVEESPFEFMARQTNIRPQFGFFFNDNYDQNDKKYGSLYLGGYDESVVDSQFVFTKVYKDGLSYESWDLTVDGVIVNGSPLVQGVGVRTLVDSGAATIRVTKALAESIFAQMPVDYIEILKSMHFDCDSIDQSRLPNVAFIINNVPFELGPDDYIEDKGYHSSPTPSGTESTGGIKPTCYFMIREMPSALEETLIILGIPFMRKYYTLFDFGKKEIGFARAKHGQKNRPQY